MFKYFGSPKLESFTSLTSKAESGVNYNACFAHVVILVLLQPVSQGIVFFFDAVNPPFIDMTSFNQIGPGS